MKRLYPNLAENVMKKGVIKRANSRVEELLLLFPGGLTVPAIAAGLGWKVSGTQSYLSRLKKQGRVKNSVRGLWGLARAKAAKAGGKPVCATCAGRSWLEVQGGDAVSYKPCPDCQEL